MDPLSYLQNLSDTQPLYEVEVESYARCIPPFKKFESRISSLVRNWELNKKFIEVHISNLSKVNDELIRDYRMGEKAFFLKKSEGLQITDSEKEYYQMGWTDDELTAQYDETVGADIDNMPVFLRGSTISFLISLVENLLNELSIIIAEDLNIDVKLPQTQMPEINRYLNFFLKGCGLDIKLNKQQNKALTAIREVRNRFIHNIDRGIPDDVKLTISEMSKGFIDDEFVDNSMVEISWLVKHIELAYIKFRNTLPPMDPNNQL